MNTKQWLLVGAMVLAAGSLSAQAAENSDGSGVGAILGDVSSGEAVALTNQQMQAIQGERTGSSLYTSALLSMQSLLTQMQGITGQRHR